jgi:hypothetical protein
MSIHAIIRAAYPDADPQRDYTIQDDGHGAYLAAWHIAGPIPAGVMLMATETAIQEFEALRGTVRASAQTLIRQITEVKDLLDANPQIAALAAEAEAGALVGNTGMTKEAVLLGIALIGSYLAYIESPLGGSGMTVRQAVYRLA